MTDNPITRRERAGQFLALLDRVNDDDRVRELTMYDPEATDSAQELWSDAGALAALLREYVADQDEADRVRQAYWGWKERALSLRVTVDRMLEFSRNGTPLHPGALVLEEAAALLEWFPAPGADDPEAHPGGVAFVQGGATEWRAFDARSWEPVGVVASGEGVGYVASVYGPDGGHVTLPSLDDAQRYIIGCNVYRRDRMNAAGETPPSDSPAEAALRTLYHDPDACTCAARGWHGDYHDGACPIGAAAHALGLDPKGPAIEADPADD